MASHRTENNGKIKSHGTEQKIIEKYIFTIEK